MDEKELVIKIQSGDMNAFERLFEKYKNEAYRYSYLITGNEYASEDIVQEAFIKCFLNIKKLKNVDKFKSWFFKIITRIAWRYSKRDKKLVPVYNIVENLNENQLDESINDYIRKEEKDILHLEIDRLGIKQKTVIILYYFNGLTVKEIAGIMGCFEGTVKSRLHSARKKLKSNLLELSKYENKNIKECEV